MTLNAFSAGRDVSLDIIGPTGPIRFNLITAFRSKPDTVDQKIKGIDGITRHARFPDGWTGSFDISRQDSVIDDLFAQLESNYYSGLNEQPMTLTETITERNGSVSQYRYVQMLLKLEDAGEWKGDKTVDQKVSFVASRRLKVS